MERDPKAPQAASSQAADLLRDTGVDVVTLANNHSMDRGGVGLEETLQALRSSGLKQCGAGAAPAEAAAPLIQEVKGKRFAFISVFDEPQPSRVPSG
jgi:poly-gamma-glutamate synthesis protein (capsule biosynthesis protein)